MKTGSLEGFVDRTWQVCHDSGELAAAVSAYTISGLDGDTDCRYRLISRVIDKDTVGNYQLTFNADTGNNYGRQYVDGSNAVASAYREGSIAFWAIAQTNTNNYISMSDLLINAKSGSVRTGVLKRVYDISGTTVSSVQLVGLSWNNSVDNITGITITAAADKINIGSRFILLKEVRIASGLRTGELDIRGTLKGAWQEVYRYGVGFNVTSGSGNAEVLVVAGGGAGGGYIGGGGGGGGVIQSSLVSLAKGTYPVSIGAGGTTANGGNSIFGSLVAIGGGSGASGGGGNTRSATAGGSGGGGGSTAGRTVGGHTSSALQGNDGGDSNGAGTGSAGGGGAGAVGVSPAALTTGGAGGIGVSSTILDGTTRYYGGGGGGCGWITTGGAGGNGGGGASGQHDLSGNVIANSTNGTANTGGGGGGGGNAGGQDAQATGGSGIVIVRYLTGSLTATGGTITTNGSYTVHTFTSTPNETSITVSGLLGNTLDQILRVRVRAVNGYNGAAGVTTRYNNDSGITYGRQILTGTDTAASAARDALTGFSNLGYSSAINRMSHAEGIYYLKSGFVRTGISEQAYDISGTTVTGIQMMGGSWNNTSDQVTSLVFVGSQTGFFGVGSEIVIERLNL